MIEDMKAACLRFYDGHRMRIHQAAAVLAILLAKPRSNALFLTGLAIAVLGETIRIWTSGYIPKNESSLCEGPYALTRRPMHFGSFLIFCGFALACSSARHWLFTILLWAAARTLYDRLAAAASEGNAQAPVFWPDRRSCSRAWETSRWRMAEVFKNKEHKIFWAFWGTALFLRLKMVYRF